MKKVRVFIASSAELDEDKRMFDLYFSEKNKLYREKNIDFDQKTWKDFDSSIAESRLQERYNEYITKCDIVIFLFHTKLGRYTKEELEVATRIFKENKFRKPKIYVYFKEDGANESLQDFKEYCESKLGHFCDLYSDYNDLMIKFDKQLLILENEGYIKSDPVDIKRSGRFFLLGILTPAIIAVAAFLAIYFYTPTTSTIRINDASGSCLDFPGAAMTLTYSDKTENAEIRSTSEETIIKEIHRRHMGRPARIQVTAKGFVPVDTTLKLAKHINIDLYRDNSLAHLFGTVKDEDNKPIEGVTVSVAGISDVTDPAGSFSITIPASMQKPQQRVSAYREGYQIWDFTGPVLEDTPWKIILKK